MSYRRPGVTVTTQNAQTIASQVGAGDRLLIIGECDIFPADFSETIRILGTGTARLSQEGVDDATISIVDSAGTALVEDTDYNLSVVTMPSGDVYVDVAKELTAISDEDVTFALAGDAVELAHQIVSDVVVENVGGTVVYTEGTDYWMDYENGIIYHLTTGTIPAATEIHVSYNYAMVSDSTALTVSYEYTPSDLYEIQEWSTLDEIRRYYGPAMDSDAVNSPISLAAQFIGNALVGTNAPQVNTLAVNPAGDPDSDPATVEATDWAAALNQINSGDATIVLCLTDNETVWHNLKSWLSLQEGATPAQRLMGFIGGGINTHTYQRCTGSTSVFGLATKRIVYVSTDVVVWNNPATGNDVLLPGYYAAAECAGITAALSLQVPLTHKRLISFKPIPAKYELTMNQKNTMASSGVCVVENNKNDGLLWVVHGKTTALTGPEDEEISIVRTLDRLATELRDSMESKFIGTGYLVDDMTSIALQSATIAFLNQKIQSQWITDFQNVAVTIDPVEPRAFLITANVKPAYPVDYIDFTLRVGTWQSS